MRGTDPAHHIHVTEKGDPGFIGIAYYVASEEDLHKVRGCPELRASRTSTSLAGQTRPSQGTQRLPDRDRVGHAAAAPDPGAAIR